MPHAHPISLLHATGIIHCLPPYPSINGSAIVVFLSNGFQILTHVPQVGHGLKLAGYDFEVLTALDLSRLQTFTKPHRVSIAHRALQVHRWYAEGAQPGLVYGRRGEPDSGEGICVVKVSLRGNVCGLKKGARECADAAFCRLATHSAWSHTHTPMCLLKSFPHSSKLSQQTFNAAMRPLICLATLSFRSF